VTARDYYLRLIEHVTLHVLVTGIQLDFDEIDRSIAYLRGRLVLSGGNELHVAEYVITDPNLVRDKYRYHLQRADGALVRRWDNAPHYPDLATFPHHCHLADGSVIASEPVDLIAVLAMCIPLLEDDPLG